MLLQGIKISGLLFSPTILPSRASPHNVFVVVVSVASEKYIWHILIYQFYDLVSSCPL